MITIIDYGLGNIRAFVNLYERLNIRICIAKTPDELRDASKIILPGVGAFDHAMTMLENSRMRPILEKLILEDNVPVLGVCVGMQILADSSEEGTLPGLGWIRGKVKKLFDKNLFSAINEGRPINDKDDFKAKNLPLPHMGWNDIKFCADNRLFSNLESNPRFYFLHSYYFECNDANNSIATASYGNNFTCAVNRNNIYGVQFHPEKSHHNGVAILKKFAEF